MWQSQCGLLQALNAILSISCQTEVTLEKMEIVRQVIALSCPQADC